MADKQYGTAQNYKELRQQGITPCIPHKKQNSQPGQFGHEAFTYDPQRDCFICPAGQSLHLSHRDHAHKRIRYRAKGSTCRKCPLASECTCSKRGRVVERHMDQENIDWADQCLSDARRRRLMGRRKSCIEGSFADAANNHHYKRARWRGLVRMRIQNLLIATCQNLRKLLRRRPNPAAALPQTASDALARAASSISARAGRPWLLERLLLYIIQIQWRTTTSRHEPEIIFN